MEIKFKDWACHVEDAGVVCERDGQKVTVFTGYIPRDTHTDRLYELEDKRDEVLVQAADEFMRILKKTDKWNLAVPSEIYNTLDSFSPSSSIPACIAYLAYQGIYPNPD